MYKIYGSPSCTYCGSAKSLLKFKNLPFEYIDVSQDFDALIMLKSEGFMTVPQIWHNGEHVGGFTDLQAYLNN